MNFLDRYQIRLTLKNYPVYFVVLMNVNDCISFLEALRPIYQDYTSNFPHIIDYANDYMSTLKDVIVNLLHCKTLGHGRNRQHFADTFSNAFVWMLVIAFRFKFHWGLFWNNTVRTSNTMYIGIFLYCWFKYGLVYTTCSYPQTIFFMK